MFSFKKERWQTVNSRTKSIKRRFNRCTIKLTGITTRRARPTNSVRSMHSGLPRYIYFKKFLDEVPAKQRSELTPIIVELENSTAPHQKMTNIFREIIKDVI